jgi:hypothetical protein
MSYSCKLISCRKTGRAADKINAGRNLRPLFLSEQKVESVGGMRGKDSLNSAVPKAGFSDEIEIVQNLTVS